MRQQASTYPRAFTLDEQAWRCYVLWDQHIAVFAVFTVLLLAEIGRFILSISYDATQTLIQLRPPAVLPITLRLRSEHKLGSGQVFTSVYFFISVGITILATTLIIFRIIALTGRGGKAKRRYRYIIEVLIESGALYSCTSLIVSVLLALDKGFTNIPRMKAMFYGLAIITPVTVRRKTWIICAVRYRRCTLTLVSRVLPRR